MILTGLVARVGSWQKKVGAQGWWVGWVAGRGRWEHRQVLSFLTEALSQGRSSPDTTELWHFPTNVDIVVSITKYKNSQPRR